MEQVNNFIEDHSENICRNCTSIKVATARSGFLAHFFLKRVFGLDIASLDDEMKARLREGGIKKYIGSIIYYAVSHLPLFKNMFDIKPHVFTDIRICMDCGFVGPDQAYSYELLSGIYDDYRSDSYNRDRCIYEPEYEKIQALVGKDGEEVKQRLENVDEILKNHADINKIKNVLDWGGGEGRFIPTCLSDKQVVILDVSNEPLSNTRYLRVSEPPEGIKFDFIQACHVLEHVSEPMEFLKNIIEHSSYGGLVYLEVPQDRSDDEIKKFQNNPIKMKHQIHEHLNLYSKNAVYALGKAAGLEVICVEKNWINSGWHKACIISGLFLNNKKLRQSKVN
jgi:hypothetical protein